MFERAFIDPRGVPGRPEYNHVINAPSQRNKYAATSFAGLSDTLAAISETPCDQQGRLWEIFKEHLAAITHLVDTAGKVLSNDLW
ncbi:Glutamate carboxypeptidase 2 [Halocaridina rubra]|uniref:Glutamate carboxypeptidase 2 n=1 Tax=Halocaridina rubra TaxID=373956 RepID=A0AAN8ZPJ5_HALRR